MERQGQQAFLGVVVLESLAALAGEVEKRLRQKPIFLDHVDQAVHVDGEGARGPVARVYERVDPGEGRLLAGCGKLRDVAQNDDKTLPLGGPPADARISGRARPCRILPVVARCERYEERDRQQRRSDSAVRCERSAVSGEG